MTAAASSNPTFEVFVWLLDTIKKLDRDTIVDVILHGPQYYEGWWTKLYHEAPLHVLIETLLIIFIVWLVFIRRTVDPVKPASDEKFSEKEVQWLVETWQPEPLVPPLSDTERMVLNNLKVIESVNGTEVKLRGVKNAVLNATTNDFLGMAQNSEIREVAVKALDFYGCGSCGPRGFYGTIDQHSKLEAAISKFMNTEAAIIYSDSASTNSSCIAAFAKKGDLIIADEACCEPLLTGLRLSRSTVHFFKHNDMAHLASMLESIAEDDVRLKRDTLQQRRFIVVEGIYRNVGDLCPLADLMVLKEKYCYRLVLDENASFGVLGKTGRGITEHFDIDRRNVEIINLPLDTVLGSIGGACVGNVDVVNHQRLSGAGYCFSASAPPFLSATAIRALEKLEQEPEHLARLRDNISQLYDQLSTIKGLTVQSHRESPVIHLTLTQSLGSVDADGQAIYNILNDCLANGVHLASSKFALSQAKFARSPSVVITASALFSKKDVVKIASVLQAAATKCVQKKK